jgi:hypothetical protein
MLGANADMVSYSSCGAVVMVGVEVVHNFVVVVIEA